jgi:hypothetical protein
LAEVIPRKIQMSTSKETTKDPIVDFVNKICWDEEEQEPFHVGLALRASGNLDFYVKYRMVENTQFTFAQPTTEEEDEDDEMNEDTQNYGKMIAVSADFDHLYFRTDSRIFYCPVSWKVMIGLKSSKKYTVKNNRNKGKSIEKIWDKITRSTLAQSMNLYPCFILFFTKVLVAH